jgi:zinc/manganese transport system ATP-binding protein
MNSSLSPEAQPIVSVQNLTVVRGNSVAVDSVSFKLFPGTHTAIIGPNGAGKSTLIQTILRLIPASSGEIIILGRNGRRLGKLAGAVGYIPQSFPFDRHFPLTVSELVSLATGKLGFWDIGKSAQKKRQAVQQALTQVNLQDRAKQRIGTLSGGEIKRVLLAYCLVVPRRLLVLDEALAGVDATGEADFAELLAKLKEKHGWTILEVSHNLSLVSRYCDRVLCLNRQLLYQGSPEAAFTPENLLQIYGSRVNPYCYHYEPTRLDRYF